MLRYIGFDTCCFLYALEHTNKGFNYEEIKTFAKDIGAIITITPYKVNSERIGK